MNKKRLLKSIGLGVLLPLSYLANAQEVTVANHTKSSPKLSFGNESFKEDRMAGSSKKFSIESINGRVTTTGGEGIPGVSISLKGTTKGSTTNVDGKYSIDLNADQLKGGVLVFSMIGYVTLEEKIGNRSSINVQLAEDSKNLEELVVIGYGSAQKKDVTGSISSIQMGDIKNQVITSLDQALQGRASGVTVNNNSGTPGGGVSVRVRGITSVSSTNEPLYVIDGIPVDGGNELAGGSSSLSFSNLGGGGGQTKQNALSGLNPNDIVSMDILKDASATAIYGSRASNGVVIITTKRGKANEAKISYDTYVGFQTVTRRLDVMNLQEYAAYQNQIRKELNIIPVEELADPSILGPGTNWQDEVFQNAKVQNHQLSFSGGKDNLNFYISGNYFDQEGTVVGSGFNRASLRFNLDSKLKNWFKFGVSTNVSKTHQDITLTDTNDGVLGTAVLQSPSVPVRYPNGNYGAIDDPSGFVTINPVAQALIRTMTRDQYKLNGNTFADISLWKGLSVRLEGGGDFSFTENLGFNPTYKYGRQENPVSTLLKRNENNVYFNTKQLLNYNAVFKNKHKVSAMVGHEAQGNTYKSFDGSAKELSSNEVTSFNIANPSTVILYEANSPWRMESYLARANYGYGDHANLTATFRNDGSSRFGPDNRKGNFVSFATNWNLTSHKFMKNINQISSLKLRAGYGQVGNQNIADYAYGSLLGTVRSSYGTAYKLNRLANPNLGWESSNQTNLGLDLGLFKNKISLTVDVYKKISEDFLLLGNYPNYLGIGKEWFDVGSPYVNQGEMQNTGLDLSLNTVNVDKSNGINWTTALVFSTYKNRLNALDDPKSVIDNNISQIDFSGETVTRTAVGQPIGQFYGYKVAGIFQTAEEVKNAAFQNSRTAPGDIQFQDLNGDKKIDNDDRAYLGSPHPDFTFGLTNSFKYKNFDLSLFVSGSIGAEIYNYTRSRTEGMIDVYPNQLKTVVNRWTPENTTGGMPRFSGTDPNQNRRVSDRFIEDGSFARISNLSFGYVLPAKLFNKMFVKKLRIYGSGQNLFTFTNYTGFDPELGSYNQNALLSNVDGGNYPTPRSLTLGLNVEF
ncbi:MAG: SusC/RagA family TonB-linked outer membrane protein [Leadbetterella sp.]